MGVIGKDGTQMPCNWKPGGLKERSESERMAMKKQAEKESREEAEDGTPIYLFFFFGSPAWMDSRLGRRRPPQPFPLLLAPPFLSP